MTQTIFRERTPKRRQRLAELAEQCQDIYDSETADMLQKPLVPVARYALLMSEGSPDSSYRDNPDLVARSSLAELEVYAARSLDEGWCPLTVVDLHTGRELGWRIRVDIG